MNEAEKRPRRIDIQKCGFEQFGGIIRDWNPLHRDFDYARSRGFKDTPAFGILLAAYAERMVVDFLRNSEFASEFHYVSHSFKFREPAYPNDSLWYRIIDINRDGESTNLRLEGVKNDGKLVVECSKIVLAKQRPIFEAPASKPIFSFEDFISEGYKVAFDRYITPETEERIPYLLVASLVPSALLKLSMRQTGKQEGVSRELNLTFFHEPEPGNFRTDIYLSSRPRGDQNVHMTSFRGICYQSDRAILSANMKVITWEDLKLQ